MSSLQETLRQRRALELPDSRSCDSAEAPVLALKIESWNGEKWVFPWSHFCAACHQGSGETDQLVLTFGSHEVVVDGAHLALLLPDIARFRLDSLREVPTKFRSQGDKNEPFVTRISVRSGLDSQERSAGTS